MNIKTVVLLMLVPMALSAQKMNYKVPDSKKDRELLIGYCNRDGFKTIHSNFDSAYQAEYPIYQPDQATSDQLKTKLKGIKVTIVMGTWCSDSREWIPRFYKIMDQAGFKYKNLKLICVDRDKKAPVADLPALKIERVPTLIFYHKKQELGRIVEVPAGLMEKDMLRIVSSH